MTGMPHTTVPASIPLALRTIRKASTPHRITGHHLEANGLATGEGPHMVGLLRAMGFVDAAGAPTRLWNEYRQTDGSERLLAEALRAAYAPLFEAFKTPETVPPRTLGTVVRDVTGYSQHHVDQTVESFRVLCARADFTRRRVADPPAATISAVRFTIQSRISGLARLAEGLQEARSCIDHGLCRPAYVSAWNGYVALALTFLAAGDFAAARAVRPSWKVTSIEELSMKTPGAELLRMLADLGLTEGDLADQLPLLLQSRNDCAHPTSFRPTATEADDFLLDVHQAAMELVDRASRLFPSAA
ncbi:DUF5343 domain-containing protein [Aeromicrobium sp. 9AM]|uniref:DUF5343 domain-containing protein n=1 Tax=Aeromicrobium sp. 9AM TaxID=2653126 RepID=UPI0012F14452|nr:DUF5343 domain-containing protein [Aeromicrobium sp. 9AM]VXB93756.1 conserved hypothetical protein [Aeromicrobium sp. 9AM]